MRSVVMIYPDRCTGCRICEMACSLSHAKECNPERSRVRVITSEEQGVLTTVPVLCMQCEKAMCEVACPTKATYRNSTGVMVVEEKKCIGCSACVYACPFGASALDPAVGKAIRCDQCEGDPRCVKFCPAQALEYTRLDKVSAARKRVGVDRLMELQRISLGLGK
jgi:carbon-monoxide dehydrogenase iron sulfur subunit